MTALGSLTASALTAAAAAAGEPSPSPSPAPSGGFEAWEVSPGLIGFIPVFLIALACVGLFLSLTKQMRRVAVRQAQQDADDAAAAAQGGGAPSDPASPGGGSRPGTASLPTTPPASLPTPPPTTLPTTPREPRPKRSSGRSPRPGPHDGAAGDGIPDRR